MAGEQEQDWKLSLPSEYQDNSTLSKFKDVGSLAKSYIELERNMGSTARMPNFDSTDPKELEPFYKKWGRPDKADEYKYPDEVLKEYPLEEQFKPKLTAFAHELGLNQKQFDKMIRWGAQESKGIFDAEKQQKQQALEALRNKWGFSAERNMERARKTVAALCGYKPDHPFVKWVEDHGYDNDPVFLESFLEFSKQLGEDNFVAEEVKKEASDRDSAQKRINEIYADPKGPYFNPNDPRHKDALEEVSKLFGVLNPG